MPRTRRAADRAPATPTPSTRRASARRTTTAGGTAQPASDAAANDPTSVSSGASEQGSGAPGGYLPPTRARRTRSVAPASAALADGRAKKRPSRRGQSSQTPAEAILPLVAPAGFVVEPPAAAAGVSLIEGAPDTAMGSVAEQPSHTTVQDTPAPTAPHAPEPTAEQAAPSEDAPTADDVDESAPSVPELLPALLSGGSILYPGIVVPYVSTETADVEAITEAAGTSARMVAIIPQELDADGNPTGGVRNLGVAAAVLRMGRTQENGVQAIVQGVRRVRVLEVVQPTPSLRVRVEPLTDHLERTPELEALVRNVLSLLQRVIALNDAVPNELALAVSNITNPGNLADFVAANLPFKPDERFAVLTDLNVTERLRYVFGLLTREVEVLEIGATIRTQVQGDLDKRQREFILREQLQAIQKELGDEDHPELGELRRKLDDANLPEAARREADREIGRLAAIPQASPEYQVTRTYLEWLADLPWSVGTEDTIDIVRAEEILNADHYGLERVKQRILDYLAVRKLRNDTRGPILCFVGPPGVGKTSLGQSIARAVGRRFVRLSLGGVRDEAEIRGHRRTYVGALPGRLIQELRRAGTNNPVMMLDEIDKLGADYRGDPASALLEVLDPAQNSTFRDHYLDIPFDLSKVLFITTANQLDPVPAPLRDRMEVIDIAGYTEREKVEIARRYLLPRQITENGLTPEQVTMQPEALQVLIRGYTREAGVRNLERLIGTLCRRVAREVARDPRYTRTIAAADVPELLDRQPMPDELISERDEIGVATGMAATSAGGDILFIEATAIPGRGTFTVTGQLGEVMKESATAALTYARLRAPEFGVGKKYFEEHDLHIHVPAGAIPKDGPSAGVTMATALMSAVTRRPIRKDVSMTGEITLRGKVLPVGAIKEKALAAHRAGVRTVIIPADNARDLDDVPEDLRAELTVVLARHVDDVLNTALHATPTTEQDRLAPELKAVPTPAPEGTATRPRAGTRRQSKTPRAATGAT